MTNISDECIIGLDTMKMFKMVLDVGKGMVGVNGKVLPGCFKCVGGAEVTLYPLETVRKVELEPSSVIKHSVAEDNSLMAEVVDDVEIEMGVFQRRIEFLWLIFLRNASLGWIQ